MKIAVLLGGILYDSQKKLLSGIMDYADEHHVNVVIFTCGGDIYGSDEHNIGEFQIYNLPDYKRYDGIIIAKDTIQNEKIVKKLENTLSGLDIPIISIDARMEGATCFEIDNAKAMYQMTAHMLCQSTQLPIVYISGPKENAESMQRLAGFLKKMQELSFVAHQDYFVYYGDYWIDSGHVCIKDFLKEEGKIPKIVICANDYMAIGAISELELLGYSVPKDVIISGFDNSYEAKNHKPRITSVSKPLREMGYEACKMLNEYEGREEIVKFEEKYFFSESCGYKRREKEDVSYLKRMMVKEKTDNSFFSKLLNQLTVDMNEAETIDEMLLAIQPHIRKIDSPFFYLCLCKNPEEKHFTKEYDYNKCWKKHSEYSSEITVAIAYEQGEFKTYDPVHVGELLPQECFEKCNSHIVVPVHYLSNVQGYCVVGKSRISLDSVWFQPLIHTLGNAIENIRKQQMLLELIDNLNMAWITDALTGVYNRAGFYRNIDGLLLDGKEQNSKLLLLFADLDKLKTVNDTYGHEEGDFYIRNAAQLIKKACGEHAIVMRYGGDEFVAVLLLTDIRQSETMIHQITTSIGDLGIQFHKPYKTSVSIGQYITSIDENTNMERLIEQADKEMYKMKQHSRKD